MSTERPETSSAPADAVGEKLRGELEHAHANLHRLEQEYEELLADPSVIQEDRDSTRRLLEQARGAATAAERAMARFEAGTYGRCARCGGEISPERLEAIPDVELCVTCSR
jgi:RNA polymerase-binding transcription factor DksA